jgi:hypothetical protein
MVEIKLKRDELLSLLNDLDGPGNIPEDADDDYLAIVVANRLMLVTNVTKIQRALAKQLPMSWRGRLQRRAIELENAARAVRDATAGRQPPTGNLVVNVPASVGSTQFYGRDGRVAVPRNQDGRIVLDLYEGEFRILLANRQHGLDWQNANPTLLAEISGTGR